MRTRETITGSLTSQTNHVTLDSVLYQTTSSGERTVKSITDVVTPGFHSLKKCGKFLPINPVIISKLTEKRIAGNVSSTNILYGQTYSGSWWAQETRELDFTAPDDDLTDAAVVAAAASAASGDWDVLTFTAELGKTVGTLASLFRDLNKTGREIALDTLHFVQRAQRRYRRTGQSQYPSFWRVFQQRWLEARYGIRPIVYDVYSVANALTRLLNQTNAVFGRGTQSEQHPDEYDSGWVTLNAYYEKRVRETLTLGHIHRGFAACSYESALNAAVQINPLVTAWELTPWSFVYDWMINIGGYIQTLRPQLTGGYMGIGSSIRTSRHWFQSVEWRGKPGMADGGWGPAFTIQTLDQYTRGPTSIPFPPLLPQITGPKVFDLITLLVTGKKRIVEIGNMSTRR